LATNFGSFLAGDPAVFSVGRPHGLRLGFLGLTPNPIAQHAL
jgi:hypothetical protein